MRILISAFRCSPYRGSEDGVGWNMATQLSKFADVTVLCGDVSSDYDIRNDLHKYVTENIESGSLHFEYVNPTWLILFLEKIHRIPGCWMFYYFAYNLWQRKAYKRALKLHAVRKFDAVHHLNMIGFREPGYLWKMGIPFFWGPVGGAANEPLAYLPMFSFSGGCRVVVRRFFNQIQKFISCRARRAALNASRVWGVTDDDCHMIRNLWGVDCEKMIETGTTVQLKSTQRSWDGDGQLRLVWSGLHIARKAFPILVEALAMLKYDAVRIHIDVLGSGPDTNSWRDLVKNRNLANSFEWHGQLNHDEALKIMGAAHALVFTSVKEGTPHVVLEALAMGLPVICHDACGMGSAVDDKSGIKISMIDPKTSIAGFSAAIGRLFDHPKLIAQFANGALERAKELTWERKARIVADAYRKYCP